MVLQSVIRAFSIAIVASTLVTSSDAGIIRHDYDDDSQYINLAQESQYDSTVKVVHGNSLCSGVLIAPDIVLTAGHCVISRLDDDDVPPGQVGDLKDNRLTEFTVTDVDNSSVVASESSVHPAWLQNIEPDVFNDTDAENYALSQGSDFALLFLDSPMASAPAIIDTTGPDSFLSTGTIVGYGVTGTGETGAQKNTGGTRRAGRNRVDRLGGENNNIYYIDMDHPTDESYSTLGSSDAEELEYLVAGGDSGGGLYTTSNFVTRLVGITSFGVGDDMYGDQGGFGRVASVSIWLAQALGGIYWRNSGEEYSVPENWNFGSVPASDSDVIFASPGSYVVDFGNAPVSARRFTTKYGNPRFGNVDEIDIDLQLSVLGGSSLTLDNGRLTTGSNVIVAEPSSVLSVTGGILDASWISVLDGGRVDVTGGITFTGGISVFKSALELTAGAVVTDGYVYLKGGRLEHTGGTLRIGDVSLNPNFGNATIAERVTVAEESTFITGPLVLGGYLSTNDQYTPSAPGELTIESNSTAITSGDVYIGGSTPLPEGVYGAGGSVTVRDSSSWTVEGNIYLASQPVIGTAEINVSNYGRVTTSGIYSSFLVGYVSIDSGSITAGSIDIPYENQFAHKGGSIIIDGGSLITAGDYQLGHANPDGDFAPARITLQNGAHWDHAGELVVASGGVGTVNLLHNSPPSIGNISVGSQVASGVLNITGAGSEVLTTSIYVTPWENDSTLLVGEGTAVSVFNSVFLGGGAFGLLEQAGELSTADLYIGAHNQAVHRVQNGAILTTRRRVYIGDRGHGTLEISGGTVNMTNQFEDVILGRRAGSEGHLVMTGGELNVLSHLDVGFLSHGTADIQDATLNIARNLYIAAAGGSSGEMLVRSGNVNAGGLFVGGVGPGEYEQRGGTVHLYGGVVVAEYSSATLSGGSLTASSLTLNDGSAFSFTGGVLNVTQVVGSLTQNGGVLLGDETPRTTTIQGDYVMNNGVFDVDLGGTGAGEFDALQVTGDAYLLGDLDVALLEAFTLGPGQYFPIVDVTGTRMGGFTGLIERALVGTYDGTDLFITYQDGDGNDISLFTLSGVSGDFDNDGVAGLSDYTVWRNNLGSPSSVLLNDVDGGVAGAAQYATWKANFGGTLSSTSNSQLAKVPEPHAIEQLAASVLVIAMAYRGRSSSR